MTIDREFRDVVALYLYTRWTTERELSMLKPWTHPKQRSRDELILASSRIRQDYLVYVSPCTYLTCSRWPKTSLSTLSFSFALLYNFNAVHCRNT